MSERTAYPLTWPENWPRTPLNQALTSKFYDNYNNRPSMDKARRELFAELTRLGVNECILSTNIKLKMDRTPYSGMSQPQDVGVAVYFQFKKKDTVIACDKWDRVECNVWAIAKTIDALRGIARWGSSKMMEQAFRGYAQLTESTSVGWWQVLGLPMNASPDQIREKYRQLVKEKHPDRGGSHDEFIRIQKAYQDSGAGA